MKNIIFILTVVWLLVNCQKKEFDQFDFSYGNTSETDFSIQFRQDNDSVFIRENWSPNDYVAPLSKTNYISQLNEIQKKEFDSLFKNIDFADFDSLYYQNYSDGNYYSFYVKKNGIDQKIMVHSNDAPKALNDFANWIYKTKKSLKLIKTTKNFEFKSKPIELEPPPAP